MLHGLISDAVIPELASGEYHTDDKDLLEAMKKNQLLGEKAVQTMSESDMVIFAEYTDELMEAYYKSLEKNTTIKLTTEGQKLGINNYIFVKQ